MPEYDRRGYFRIDLADNCNIRCIMCQAYNSLPVNSMNFLDFDAFVTQTRGELRHWQSIQLGNVAEATIHPRFADFLRYVRSEAPDAQIHLVTNGKTLHKHASLINELGNCLVQISMDSISRRTHEYIREGSRFDRAMENIALLEIPRTRVLLSFTLMRSNIEEYPEMVACCQERGYQMAAFPMIVRSEAGVLPYNLLQESLWFNVEYLRAWLQDYYGAKYPMMVGTGAGAMQQVSEFSCNAHYDDLNMDSAGNTNLCGKLTLGNLHGQTLHDLWNSDEAAGFRDQVDLDREPCMTCDYRQRCLSPSMALLDNHFSEELVRALSAETKAAIGYDRSISDDHARWLFVQDVGNKCGIFEICQVSQGWIARKAIPTEAPGVYQFSGRLDATSRHELHEMMQRESDSGLYVRPLESYGGYNLVKYQNRYWALPVSLGVLNITREADRQKPGILYANSIDELKILCAGLAYEEPPRLIERLSVYNLVSYKGKFWALPLALGPYDLTVPENQTGKGILTAYTLQHLRELCNPLHIVANA